MYTAPVAINGQYEIMIALGLNKEGSLFDVNKKFRDYLIKDMDILGNKCHSPVYEDSISTPHSSSFIDLNGDCMPDIFMQKQHKNTDGSFNNYYEIYVHT